MGQTTISRGLTDPRMAAIPQTLAGTREAPPLTSVPPRGLGFALLMLSAGTPLMTGGDEYLRSLQCNNNPYNVDSVANWLNYKWTGDQTNFQRVR